MKKLNLIVLGIASLSIVSLNADAEAPETYIGIGQGEYKFEFDSDDIDTDFEDDQGVSRIYIGSKFSETVGIEFSFLEFDDANQNNLETEIEGLSLAGILSAPLSEHFSVFGKAGWFSWQADVDGQIGTGPAAISFSNEYEGDDLFYGLGLKLGLTNHVDLRVDYDRYELDEEIDPELDILSANVQFVF